MVAKPKTTKTATTVLIDGDVVAYKAASISEKATDWGDGIWTLHADAGNAKRMVNTMIDSVIERTEATAVVVALSDSNRANLFRKELLPSYKANRSPTRKPICLAEIVGYLHEEYKCFERPRLEGDDILGILATSSEIIKGRKIIVSIDKDMKSIPGLYFNDGKPALGVVEISEEEAARFHLFQTLTGDAVDNYPGCPGIGPKRASDILDNAPDGHWAAVVAAFAKAGLGEEEALNQARIARILRASDYDFAKKEPILWKPC